MKQGHWKPLSIAVAGAFFELETKVTDMPITKDTQSEIVAKMPLGSPVFGWIFLLGATAVFLVALWEIPIK